MRPHLSPSIVRSVQMGVPDVRKMDGSELQKTLERPEHRKGMEVQNRMREVKRYGTYSVGVKDLASAYVLCAVPSPRRI